jgi:hypothetical protein
MLFGARRTSLRHSAELAEVDLGVKLVRMFSFCCSIYLNAYAVLNDRSNRHESIPGWEGASFNQRSPRERSFSLPL